MTKLTEVTVFFDNGDYLSTQINGTRESINDYYLGKEFNLGNGENDIMARAQDVLVHDYRGAYEKENVMKFAYNCKRLGFKVFLAESNTHGLLTDDKETRVLSFERYFGGVKLSGNYSSLNNGSGWRICEFCEENPTREKVNLWLYAHSPFEHKGYTTLETHFKTYQSSSKYRKV